MSSEQGQGDRPDPALPGVQRRPATFLREFVATPGVTGAVAPSSRQLAGRMVEWIDWPRARVVLECGPGTGALTASILERLDPGGRYFAVEINPNLIAHFQRRFPHATVYKDTVRNLGAICRVEGVDEVDVIVSSLPWASFTPLLQQELLAAMTGVLRPGGQFVTFAYNTGLLLSRGRAFRRLLPGFFSEVRRSKTAWINLPPAFVYRCRR
jgi:phosphatidylethanolamine/phosphatidyl-N-methylethanolamine N-methyltransferase